MAFSVWSHLTCCLRPLLSSGIPEPWPCPPLTMPAPCGWDLLPLLRISLPSYPYSVTQFLPPFLSSQANPWKPGSKPILGHECILKIESVAHSLCFQVFWHTPVVSCLCWNLCFQSAHWHQGTTMNKTVLWEFTFCWKERTNNKHNK